MSGRSDEAVMIASSLHEGIERQLAELGVDEGKGIATCLCLARMLQGTSEARLAARIRSFEDRPYRGEAS